MKEGADDDVEAGRVAFDVSELAEEVTGRLKREGVAAAEDTAAFVLAEPPNRDF